MLNNKLLSFRFKKVKVLLASFLVTNSHYEFKLNLVAYFQLFHILLYIQIQILEINFSKYRIGELQFFHESKFVINPIIMISCQLFLIQS